MSDHEGPVLHERGCRFEDRRIHGCNCSDKHIERIRFRELSAQERMEQYEAYVARENKLREPEPKTRCYDCGAIRLPKCADHPNAMAVTWGRRQGYAWRYVCSVSLGAILDFYDAKPSDYPGVERDDLEWVQKLHERWGERLPEEGPERKGPSSPRGLFG